jgi:hypothetical protein
MHTNLQPCVTDLCDSCNMCILYNNTIYLCIIYAFCVHPLQFGYVHICVLHSYQLLMFSGVPATPGSFGNASVLVLRCPSQFCTSRGSHGPSLCTSWHFSTCGGGEGGLFQVSCRAGSVYRNWLVTGVISHV